MNQFTRSPQTSQGPEYDAETLTKFLSETDLALSASLTVLMRGKKSSDVYEPWSKGEVKESLDTILALFENKVHSYEGAGEVEKAILAQEKVNQLKNIFSEIDGSEGVPEGFLEKVKRAVESK